MQKTKIIVRSYDKKAGGKFIKLSMSGKFVPDILAEEDKEYQVKFSAKSVVKEPTQEGIYDVAFNDGELWIDNRPQYAGKYIVRVIAQKVRFYKPLPVLDKDVRI